MVGQSNRHLKNEDLVPASLQVLDALVARSLQ
jgi:hypothetical protein